jgi:hypothetical protein
MRFLRYAFAAYLLFLTLLLLAPDPWALLGFKHPMISGSGRGIHLLFFSGLAFLASGSRFNLRPWILAAALIGYGAATEVVQRFVPPRSVDLVDFLEDLSGTLVGIGFWQACAFLAKWWVMGDQEPAPVSAKPSGDLS